jgi:hypothetical protein
MYQSILKTSSADSAVVSSPPNKKRIVRFDCLVVKEFPIELGDNVPNTGGAPVGMRQTACRSSVINLEHFESIRPPRRHRKSLIVTRAARTERLMLAGHSFEEIADATQTARSIRVSRNELIFRKQASNNKQGLSRFVQSTVGRLLKNIILPGKSPGAPVVAKSA